MVHVDAISPTCYINQENHEIESSTCKLESDISNSLDLAAIYTSKQNPYLEIIHRILANKNVFRKQNHFKKSWKFDKCHMQVLKNHPMHFSKQNHLQQTKVAM